MELEMKQNLVMVEWNCRVTFPPRHGGIHASIVLGNHNMQAGDH
jgi:hypothetical protein